MAKHSKRTKNIDTSEPRQLITRVLKLVNPNSEIPSSELIKTIRKDDYSINRLGFCTTLARVSDYLIRQGFEYNLNNQSFKKA